MLKRLIEFLQNNFPDSNINEYLDAKYIHLENDKLKKIADAIKANELQIKPASHCSADNFIFHFGSTLILVKKSTDGTQVFDCELAWETDFQSIYSAREKIKGFYFIKFGLDDDYNINLQETDKREDNQVRSEEQEREVITKILPVLKGFISAISE
jgi:hypothetical protein